MLGGMTNLDRLEQLSRSLDQSGSDEASDVIERVAARAPVLLCRLTPTGAARNTRTPAGVTRPPEPLRFDWVSDSWRRLCGYSPAALQGKPLADVVHPDDRYLLPQIASKPHGRVHLRLRTAGKGGAVLESSVYRVADTVWARHESDTSVFATLLCEE